MTYGIKIKNKDKVLFTKKITNRLQVWVGGKDLSEYVIKKLAKKWKTKKEAESNLSVRGEFVCRLD